MINLYGWSDRDGQAFAPYEAQGYVPGRVVVQQRGLYTLVTVHGELRAQLAGRLVHEVQEGGRDGDLPVVGDWGSPIPRVIARHQSKKEQSRRSS